MKEFLLNWACVIIFIFMSLNLVGFGSAFMAQKNCTELLSFKEVLDKPTKTTVDKIFTKPMAIFVYAGVYLGYNLATPSICYKE